MGNEEASCLTPNIGGKDTEIYKAAKGIYSKAYPGYNDFLKNNIHKKFLEKNSKINS